MQRENPNSTNPFFLNKARSPDKLDRLGFNRNNDLRRTPEEMIIPEKAAGDKDIISESQPAQSS